jgi:hypothetical protein
MQIVGALLCSSPLLMSIGVSGGVPHCIAPCPRINCLCRMACRSLARNQVAQLSALPRCWCTQKTHLAAAPAPLLGSGLCCHHCRGQAEHCLQNLCRLILVDAIVHLLIYGSGLAVGELCLGGSGSCSIQDNRPLESSPEGLARQRKPCFDVQRLQSAS